MTSRLFLRAGIAAVLAVAAAAAPAAAAAAAPVSDPTTLVAVTEVDAATHHNQVYPVGRGADVPAALGVASTGDTAVRGLVLHVRAVDDLDLPKRYDNCWYYVDSNLDGAYCEFDDELAAGATLAVAGPVVTTAADARPDKVKVIIFRWFTKAEADAKGGAQKLAQAEADKGTTVQRGSGATVRLEARSLPLPSPGDRYRVNFAYPKLVLPATEPTPTARPTESAQVSAPSSTSPAATPSSSSVAATPATPTSTSAAPGAAGGAGGGGSLPLTGTPIAVIGVAGAVLLLLGGAGYLAARRRRTRFVA
ncbi:LPXTG cell wall anchor domain-containing protein [Krasilnikovia sp. M28-CT-15]|uniref:LPXTG cell wall anchor domain-containing protein n=1 Tax=Krasilnikovia sp. M28-CT-15 TaxID=3373540 RepID=UPI0038771D34